MFSAAEYDRLVDLVADCRSFTTPQARDGLIDQVFTGTSRPRDIDVTGPPLHVVRHILPILQGHQPLPDGQPPLERLLLLVRSEYGINQQVEIDQFCQIIRQQTPQQWQAGTVLGSGEHTYTLVRVLGDGGNGVVWLAEEATPDWGAREVAIKALKPEISADEVRVRRFQRELGVVMRMQHDHITPVFSWGRLAGHIYAVMAYAPGGSLRKRILNRAFSMDQVVSWLEQMAWALDYAHRQGIVHRDVKPENMLLGTIDEEERLYLADFGLVFSPGEGSRISGEGRPVGSGRYMAPEQWRGEPPTAQTDSYALCIMAYELLTGHLPFQQTNDPELGHAHCYDALPEDPKLADEVLRILQRAAAKAPGERYPTARAFVSDLRHWEADPANINIRVPDYLDWLTADIHERVSEQFVELAGETRVLRQVAVPRRRRKHPGLSADDDVWARAAAEIHADHMNAAETEQVFVKNIRGRLQTLDRCVLVGEPGSGKSWMLWRVTLDYAQAWLETDGRARLPVLVYLNEFTGEDEAGQPQSFADFVRIWLDMLGPYHNRLRQEGRLIILCDALNEMPRKWTAPDGSQSRNLLQELKDYLRETPNFVVSCRIRDYTDDLNDLGPLEQVVLRNLGLPAIQDLIAKRLADETGAALWQEIGGSDDLMTFWREISENNEEDRFWDLKAGVPDYTAVSGDEAWRAMHGDGRRLMALCQVPFTANLVCRTYAASGGDLPGNRAALFGQFIDQMLANESRIAERRGESYPDFAGIGEALALLAQELQEHGVTVIARRDALLVVGGEDAESLLVAATNAGILATTGDGIRFAHQLFQEYFAVQVLLDAMGDVEQPTLATAQDFFPEEWWDAGVWRETMVILGEQLGGARGANQAARWLAEASPEVALDVILRHGVGLTQEDVEPETEKALVAGAQALIAEADPRGRAAAYCVLGRFDADTREGIGLDENGVPKIAWCEVPAGEFIYQDGQRIKLPRFYMAKYPVTYRQFQAFIEAEDGFHNPKWWAGLSANAEHKSQPEDQRFEYWNHPREQVSWYDAVAFCRWLSERLGYEVRLPTEQEWEKAARGTDGREHPWGGKYISGYANIDETARLGFGEKVGDLYVGQTTAVGMYPQGESPYGVLDMSGNVWEWCMNEYSEPENVQTRGDAVRVVRGGSWNDQVNFARSVDRFSWLPNYRNFNQGFRVCCGRPPLGH